MAASLCLSRGFWDLQRGVQLHEADKQGMTPLMLAAKHSPATSTVKLLLDLAGDSAPQMLLATDDMGQNAMFHAFSAHSADDSDVAILMATAKDHDVTDAMMGQRTKQGRTLAHAFIDVQIKGGMPLAVRT